MHRRCTKSSECALDHHDVSTSYLYLLADPDPAPGRKQFYWQLFKLAIHGNRVRRFLASHGILWQSLASPFAAFCCLISDGAIRLDLCILCGIVGFSPVECKQGFQGS